MNRVFFPLKQRAQGATVTDLQAALQVVLDRAIVLANDASARSQISTALAPERESKTYGPATAKAVSIFQQEKRLLDAGRSVAGEVDEPTANALNATLEQLQLVDPVPARPAIVSGQVAREDGQPLPGLRVRATHDVAAATARTTSLRLGDDVTDAQGRYTVATSLPGTGGINLRMTVFDAEGEPCELRM